MPTVNERGSMSALFVSFVATCLLLSCIAINSGSAFLFKQRLQSKVDQLVLADYEAANSTLGETQQRTLCETWTAPLKVIGLPNSQQICAKSAAR